MRYDAIVAGAGPAGAAAALTLARGGARVALLDRERFPRDKPCGDLLGRDAVAQCRALGVELDALGAFRVRGVSLRAPGGATLHGVAYREPRGDREARVITRARFDAALVARAVEAGATLLHAHVTEVLRDAAGAVIGVSMRPGASEPAVGDVAAHADGRDADRTDEAAGPVPGTRYTGSMSAGSALRAPLLIGADGWGSGAARALLGPAARPAQRGMAARCYVEGVRGLRGRMRFFVERDLLPGCAWIFPLGEDRANVGLGTLVPDGAGHAPRPAARLAAWLAAPRGSAADLLRDARRTSAIVTWPLAIGWRAAPVAFDGALLAGDAAALISPMSGSGIAAALHSGRLAGEAGLRALARGDLTRAGLLPYERALRAAYRPRYTLERAGQAVLYHQGRLDLLARLAPHVPYSQLLAGNLLFNLG